MIRFPGKDLEAIAVEPNGKLSEYLTVQNSPVLFGCRTGICGTCLVIARGNIAPPDPEEKEILEIFSPGNSQTRLACQIRVTSDIEISPFIYQP